MWHVKSDMWHVTWDTSHVTCDMRYMTCDMWHVTGNMCSRVFQIFYFLFFFAFFYLKKSIMKNVHSKSPHQRLCNSPTIQMFFVVVFLVTTFFWFTFQVRNPIFFLSSKVNKKIQQLIKQNYHPNCWTVSLLVMQRFLNYAKFYLFFWYKM